MKRKQLTSAIARLMGACAGIVLAALLCVTSCKKPDVLPSSISVTPSSATVTEGETATFTASVLPAEAVYSGITWSSSDTKVATVNNGVVTGVNAGSATITASADGVKGSATVTVTAKIIAVTGVSLDKTELTLTEGEEAQLKATVAPDNATEKSVNWKSADESIATVSSEGKVTAVKAGTATITVTTEDGGKTATCAVTVNAKIYPVESVSLNKSSLTMTEGDNAQLTATIKPENASNKNVSWKSSNAEVAKVTSDGKVTAVKAGTATITVTTEDGGKTATCKVTVNAKVYPVTGVSLNKTSLTLTEGDSAQFTATVKPDNATNKNVSWKSSDTSVATVSSEGKVTAVKAGTATITVTTEDGGKTATCAVNVLSESLPGMFSVSATKKVRFAKGNLQTTYNGSKYNWGFAAHQYDYVGKAPGNTTIDSQTSGAVVDLFGWSTASSNYGIKTSTDITNYSGDFMDWGKKIGDGSTWRTLSKDEWVYLFDTRPNASSLYRTGVTVCGKTNCLIIAPDGFAETIASSYDASTWPAAEAAGLVCLPAAGTRQDSSVFNVGLGGFYWSSSAYNSNSAYDMDFGHSTVRPGFDGGRYLGFSVRLVTDVK